MSCKALPTLPPPTMTAGATLVEGTVTVVAAAAAMAENLNLNAVVAVGETDNESEVAIKKRVLSGGGRSEEPTWLFFVVFVCGAMLCHVCPYSFTRSLSQVTPLVRSLFWEGSIC